MSKIRKIGLMVKEGKQPEEAAARLSSWLGERNVEVFRDIGEPDLDMVVVLGGDGTLLYTARLVSDRQIPILGIYFGRLGFLTEISCDENLYPKLERILAGDYQIEKRMMLKTSVISNGSVKWTGDALNEVVVNKGALSTMIQLSVRDNEDLITKYYGDGLIVSTPTGSTAYNLSAGGPIVHPELMLIVLTPICPFMLSSRPIILPDASILSVQVTARSPDVHLILDGQVNYELGRGESLSIRIERGKKLLQLIKLSKRSYFSVLRSKLKWGEQETPSPVPPDFA